MPSAAALASCVPVRQQDVANAVFESVVLAPWPSKHLFANRLSTGTLVGTSRAQAQLANSTAMCGAAHLRILNLAITCPGGECDGRAEPRRRMHDSKAALLIQSISPLISPLTKQWSALRKNMKELVATVTT